MLVVATASLEALVQCCLLPDITVYRLDSKTLKTNNLQYNTVGRWVDGTIVPSSDGPMFILIDWE